MQNGKYGFINTNGEMTISCKYDDASNFREGLAVVKLDGKYGYVNKQGIDTFSKQNKATIQQKIQSTNRRKLKI